METLQPILLIHYTPLHMRLGAKRAHLGACDIRTHVCAYGACAYVRVRVSVRTLTYVRWRHQATRKANLTSYLHEACA
jgi:hypothetical protein